MFITTHSNHHALRSGVCLLLSALIVSVSLACGVLGVQSLESRALDVSTQIRAA
ncbi:MAG TPA: hypothetical protein VFR96_13225 [Povalibacter sp.]|jgi:hypothetical protein|nr:hypothetical protein [Povalibacter sp.]